MGVSEVGSDVRGEAWAQALWVFGTAQWAPGWLGFPSPASGTLSSRPTFQPAPAPFLLSLDSTGPQPWIPPTLPVLGWGEVGITNEEFFLGEWEEGTEAPGPPVSGAAMSSGLGRYRPGLWNVPVVCKGLPPRLSQTKASGRRS